MIDRLIQIVARVGHWGYLIIFVVVVLECQALLGFFMPGESLVMVGGFFAAQGDLNPGLLIVVVAVAAMVGDNISFELGRHFGRGWILAHGARFGLRPERLDRVDRFFDRHGGQAVFTGHFLHVLRALMPFVAGTRHMRYWRFLAYNSAGCVVWAAIFVYVGYFVGESWRVVEKWLGRAGALVAGVLLVAILAGSIWRRRHAAPAAGVPPDVPGR